MLENTPQGYKNKPQTTVSLDGWREVRFLKNGLYKEELGFMFFLCQFLYCTNNLLFLISYWVLNPTSKLHS